MRRILVISLGLGLCALVALRLLLGGPGWVSAATGGLTAVVVLDVALLLGGAWLLRREWRQKLARHGATPAKGLSPLPKRQRKWLLTAMLVPGVLLALAEMWASLTYGWLLSEVLASRL